MCILAILSLYNKLKSPTMPGPDQKVCKHILVLSLSKAEQQNKSVNNLCVIILFHSKFYLILCFNDTKLLHLISSCF